MRPLQRSALVRGTNAAVAALLVMTVAALAACDSEPQAPASSKGPGKEAGMKLTSSAFAQGDEIPARFTCDGEDIAPQLEIEDIPEATEVLVLVMEDPDAPVGTWDHWVAFNIEPTASIPEGAGPELGTPGRNSWGRQGYGGPCPPGGRHRYFFRVLALNQRLDLEAGATKVQVLSAADGHVIEQAELMGTYAR